MSHHWETISSSSLLSRNRFTVHTDQAVTPSGEQVIYDWVSAADIVRIAALAPGHIWMVNQYHYLPRRRLWQLPGGGVDDGETAEAAARRELAEETGLTAANWRSAGTVWPLPGMTAVRIHLWIATGLAEGNPSPEPYEADLLASPVPLAEARSAVTNKRIGCPASAQLIWTILDLLDDVNE